MSRDEMTRTVYASFSRGMEAPTLTDFEEGLRALNVDVFSQDTIRHIFEKSDKNNDGRLSSHEFRGLCDVYPKFVECLFHRLNDKRARDIQEEAIHQASQNAESIYAKTEAMQHQLEAANQRLRESEEALAEETKRLEEERQRETEARAKDDAERVDQVSSRQADQVASALDKQAKGVCAEKKEQFYSTLSEADIRTFANRLANEWRKKDGDVVDELIENLKVPETVHSKLAVVAEAAKHLHQTKGEAYPCRNRVELLAMTLYTMAGPDIDALVTYENVPVYDEDDKEPWEHYNKTYSKERNSAIFSTINWAMRTAADPSKADSKDGQDAWAACCKWVKYIGLLMFICSQVEPDHADRGAELARGLAGLPSDVLEAHRAMLPNDSLCWPAASSCAFDRSVSESYIKGSAANATTKSGGSILFLLSDSKCGASLQHISKYPKESEMLLPPFSTFKIGYQDIDAALPGTCVIHMTSDGHAIPTAWIAELAAASHQSAQRLQTALVTHAESALRERQSELERQKQRERQAGSDVVKTEREVDRQRNRLVMSQQDAKRAEDRLRELEKLLEEQHAEVSKQHEIVKKTTQELKDAESMAEAAAYDKELASRSVQSAEETVKEAEEVLNGVKKAKEQRRLESQARLSNAKKDTTNREKARDDATAKVNREKAALQQAKHELEAANNELAEAERKVNALRDEAAEAIKRRKNLDAEEAPILDLEVKLVMQRRALEEKEAKHYKDLRSFDEQWRPASPRDSQGQLAITDNQQHQPRGSSKPLEEHHDSSRRENRASTKPQGEHIASPPPLDAHKYDSEPVFGGRHGQEEARKTGTKQSSQNELPPPKPASQTTGEALAPVSYSLTLLDDNDVIGLIWEGAEDGAIYVKSVSDYGAAKRAGVRAGLRLMSVDGVPIGTREDLKHATNQMKIKKYCNITFYPQSDLQMKLEKSDEENKVKDQRIRELERRLRSTEQLEGVHLSPLRPKSESLTKHEPIKHEPIRQEPTRHESARHETSRHEPSRHEPFRHEPTRHEPARHESTRHELIRLSPSRHDPIREPLKHEPARPDPARSEPLREPLRSEPLRSEPIRSEPPKQPSSVQPAPSSAISTVGRSSAASPTPSVGRPQTRLSGSMSAVEQIRQKMLNREMVASPPPIHEPTHTPRPAPEKEVQSRDSPMIAPASTTSAAQEPRAAFYLPQSAVDNAKSKEAALAVREREDVRVGRPLPVARPASAAQPTPVTLVREYSSVPSRGISPAVPSSTLLTREDTGASLERRIARLSAEVAASRERASHPRSGR
eukprot:TRINITY_DN977_c0_g1_i2.p1 TRINITY_DN977_c0_g1~~TRINITY_DN977_c0_g1_i2.p1  ORF type:complete len:1305 (+),score=307.25 TRINITY_DN977_c0_g1_i2:46-3915(+)